MTTNFGHRIEHYSIEIDTSHIRPAQNTRVENDWWVTLATAGMVNAAIQVYDNDFQQVRTIMQAPNADPISIAYFNKTVWASDTSNFSLTGYDRSGETVNTALPHDLNDRLAAAMTERDEYNSLSNIGHWLFIGVLGFGIIGAFIIEKKKTIDTLTGRIDDEDTNSYTNTIDSEELTAQVISIVQSTCSTPQQRLLIAVLRLHRVRWFGRGQLFFLYSHVIALFLLPLPC